MAKIADPNFDKYVFVFKRDNASGFFRLEGMAYDASGNTLGTSFLPAVRSQGPRPLPNLLKGIFTLDKTTLASAGIDGTFDCFLNPKKSHEGEGGEKKYVSYKIIDRDASLALRAFSMNPSPPYNTGNISRP